LLSPADLRVVLMAERLEVRERPDLAAVLERLAVVDVGRDPIAAPVLAQRLVKELPAPRVAPAPAVVDRLVPGPELDLNWQSIEWTTVDDRSRALLVSGGGIDRGNGTFFANAGDNLHAVGSRAPVIEGYVGCIVIRPDGSR
jgi:hypothetical protein